MKYIYIYIYICKDIYFTTIDVIQMHNKSDISNEIGKNDIM